MSSILAVFRSVLLYLTIICCINKVLGGCNRVPTHLPHSRRTRGDNGYKLIVADSANGYVPGKTYNILLIGSRTHNYIQHFTHFTISAEVYHNKTARNGGRQGRLRYRSTPASPQRVGHFQLFSDGFSKFSEQCVNTVMESDSLPKTEVQVMWVAPLKKGLGCISISAMVYENPQSWFIDDGNLSQIICEQRIDSNAAQKECCACDEAKYSFIFEGIWSNETHPKYFPFAVWLTHFSDIVGASHEANFSFWGENHIATDGFRSLAEFGSPGALETELRGKGAKLRTLIKAPGLWYPNVNTNTTSHFRVDRKHHKVSMVSMFGPSPDWVVGINGVNLCTNDCKWLDKLEFDLYPWDAGTDSGISYMSPNLETQPRERMYRITTMYPEDPRSPFYNPHSKNMVPLAKLYLTREKVIPRNCDHSFLEALQSNLLNEAEETDTRFECRVTEYSNWSPCSVTCGKGIRMRTRQYKDPELAQKADCNQQLISKEMCVTDIPDCGDNIQSREYVDEDDLSNLVTNANKNEGEGGICQTTTWSAWSECSATCGIGISMRTRTFHNHLGRKRCPHISVVEKQKCMKPECSFELADVPDPMCPTSQWSDWSPCTATCGIGVTIRTRLLLLEDETLKMNCTKKIELHQQKECKVSENCVVNRKMAQNICSMTADSGPCRGSFLRYAYNMITAQCEAFNYGGCRGNRNNFINKSQCMAMCDELSTTTTTNSKNEVHVDNNVSNV